MSFEEKRIDPCDANAAPYVLGALTDEEHEVFHRHLSSCAVCREEVAALQVVADALPVVAPQMGAPSGLKRRVMASVHADVAASGSRQSARVPRRSLLDALGWRPVLGVAAAALVIALLAIALIPGGSANQPARVIKAQVAAPQATASLLVSAGHAELDVAGMPQTAPNRVYQVWVKRSGAPQPTDALFTVTAKGAATVGVPGSVSGIKEILVTSEPVGGSRVPTRAPVIVANLS